MSKPTDIERVKAVLYLKLDENLSNRDIARGLPLYLIFSVNSEPWIVAGRYLSMPPINVYISHFILTGKRAVLNLIMA